MRKCVLQAPGAQAILDSLITDVAVDVHRSLSLGLETLDSVQERVPPSDAGAASHQHLIAAAAATADSAGAGAAGGMGPLVAGITGMGPSSLAGGLFAGIDDPAAAAITVKTPPGKVGKGTKDVYGRTGGASKEAAECPVCLQKVAAARFAQHLERCMVRSAYRLVAVQPTRRRPQLSDAALFVSLRFGFSFPVSAFFLFFFSLRCSII